MPDQIENRTGASFAEKPVTRAEMETLRQRLVTLEADLAKCQSARGRRGNLIRQSTRMRFALLILVAAFIGASIIYGQGAATALFIDPQGNVGIGIAPKQRLDVAGTIRSSNGGIQFPDNTTQTTAAVTIPAHAVVAFNLQTCPAGWSDYTPGYGLFIRGIDKSGKRIDADGQRALESIQGDAIRNITGSISGVLGASNMAWPWGFRPGTSGAFSVPKDVSTYNKYAGDYSPPSGVGTSANFDASKAPGVLTANENRPKNVALLYCQKN